MKKILVVFTGGTIGSTAADGTIVTSSAAPFKLLQLFQAYYPDYGAIQFDSLQPLQILSENLAPTAWKIIVEAIESAQTNNYDGIIVTHGTDTLAYSAAALSFYFHALTKPLLLVSSDYPLDNPKGNGLVNFMCAVEFIRQNIANGVFVPYRNAGQTMQIHRGSRLTCSLQLSGDFYSVQNKSFAEFVDNAFILKNSSFEAGEASSNQSMPLLPEFSNRVLMIKPYPGLDYQHFDLDGVVAVLHDLYHSGTACATTQWGNNHSLIDFLKRCRSRSIPVFLAPAFKSENTYQTTRELIDEGAKMIWNVSIEAAYVKLTLAYGNFADAQQIVSFIESDIAYERISTNKI
jgi:L-asparaginase/Glu-tRNA(Gln) amidotransferase subunit D